MATNDETGRGLPGPGPRPTNDLPTTEESHLPSLLTVNRIVPRRGASEQPTEPRSGPRSRPPRDPELADPSRNRLVVLGATRATV